MNKRFGSLVGSMMFAAALLVLPACGGAKNAPAATAPTAGTTAGPVTGGTTIEHAAAHITIELPSGWTSKPDDDSLMVSDPTGEVVVAFMVVPVGAVHEATKALGENLSKNVKNLKLGDEDQVDINGMQSVVVDGDGTVDGTNVDILVALVDTPADDKDLMVLAIAEDAKLARHKDEISFLFHHIKPAN